MQLRLRAMVPAFDVRSFHADGTPKFIEVKTTRRGAATEFYVSSKEVKSSRSNPDAFYIYRVYDLDPLRISPKFYVVRSALEANFANTPIQFSTLSAKLVPTTCAKGAPNGGITLCAQ